MKKLLMGAGSAALVAGMFAVAFGAFGAGSAAQAGQTTVIPCDATPTATPTEIILTGRIGGGNVVFVAGETTQSPVPTCTPTSPAHTHTPTPSATPEDTATPGVTSTPVPASPTNTPSGDPGGDVSPPDTGTGPGDNGGMNYWFVIAGLALLTVGGGAVALGMRRR